MNDIEKAVELYTLMAERCENNGLSHNQAQVYREMIDLIQSCSTITEATDRIKNSEYYLAPSVALIQDKLTALKNASLKNGMPEVAAVYEEKLKKIDSDSGEIYDSSHEVTAQNFRIRYVQSIEAFCSMYSEYIRIRCAQVNDSDEISDAINKISEANGKLDLPTSSFTEFAANTKMRDLISCSDVEYERFVRSIPSLLQNNYTAVLDVEAELGEIDDELNSCFDNVKNAKTEIIAAGKQNAGKVKHSRVTVISPKNSEGKYQYINEEIK